MTDPHLDVVDNPIERLELLAGDEEAIASFLDQIDVTALRDREMLGELARTQTLADPERFPSVRRARYDAEALVGIFKRREIGLPSFVIGGLLIPVFATGWRLAQGVAFRNWWLAALTGLITVLVVVGGSWVILRGAARRAAGSGSRREHRSKTSGARSATVGGRHAIRVASSP